MQMVVPPWNSNRNLPDLACGYADVGGEVIDLNTSGHHEYIEVTDPRYSVQARSLEWVKQRSNKSFTVEDITVQCSYSYCRLEDNLHVGRLAVPKYHRFTSWPTFQYKWLSGKWPMPVLTSFGCPYSCKFCDAHTTGWKPRLLNDLWLELEAYTPARIQIADACFNFKEDHVLSVCQALDGIPWECPNGLRADRLTEKMAAAMKDCYAIALGVECPDNDYLWNMRKGETLEDIERGIKIAKDHFPSVTAYLIDGFGDTTKALDWAANQGVYVHLSKLNTIPFEQIHTPLDSPSKRIVGDRLSLLRHYGTRAMWRYLRMDAAKVMR